MKEVRYFSISHTSPSAARERRHRLVQQMLGDHAKLVAEDAGFEASLRHLDVGDASDDWYRGIFGFAPVGSVCGEISPEYTALDDREIRHVASVAPAAKLIVCMRDPIERSWSHTCMLARRLNLAGPREMLTRRKYREYMFVRSDYAGLLRKWRRWFGEGQIVTLALDEIEQAPLGVLERVCGYLGVGFRPEVFTAVTQRVGGGRNEAMPEDVRSMLKELHRPIYESLGAEFPGYVEAWRRRHWN